MPDTPTRSEFAARVIDLMHAAGLQGEVAHDEIAGKLTHTERDEFDLEHAYRHFTVLSARLGTASWLLLEN